MKKIQCSKCNTTTLRGFPCPVCNPQDEAFYLRRYVAVQKEEHKLLKQALRERVDEKTYHDIMNLYNRKLQQFRKGIYPFIKDCSSPCDQTPHNESPLKC